MRELVRWSYGESDDVYMHSVVDVLNDIILYNGDWTKAKTVINRFSSLPRYSLLSIGRFSYVYSRCLCYVDSILVAVNLYEDQGGTAG